MTAQQLLEELLKIPEEERETISVFTSVTEAYYEMPINSMSRDIPDDEYAKFNPYMTVGQEILWLHN